MLRLMKSRTAVVVGMFAAVTLTLCSGVAFAVWSSTSSTSISSPTDALSTPSLGAVSGVTSSGVTVNWSDPGSWQSAATYTATATATNHTTQSCNALASALSCALTGLDAGTTYSVSVSGKLNNWLSSAATTTVTPTQAITTTSVSTLSITNKSTAPAGTAGKMDSGDRINVTFSAAIKASTVCSAWADTGNQTSSTATVRVVGTPGDSDDDVLTINSWTGCSTFHFGSIDLGSASYQLSSSGTSNKPVDFTGSTIAYDATAHTLTVTLGTAVTNDSGHGLIASTAVTSSVATWSVDGAIKDANNTSITPLTKATANVQQF